MGGGHRARRRQFAFVQQQRRPGQGQRGVLAAQAEIVDDALDVERAVAAVAPLTDGLDPVAEVGQHVGGQCQQLAVGRLAIGQAAVEELFAGPRGFAEGRQADHARTALQGVEGAPHAGHLAEIVGAGDECCQGLLGTGDDLARFLEEDLAHLVVVFEAGLARRRRCGRQLRQGPRRRQRIERSGFGRGMHEVGHGLCQFVAYRLAFVVVAGLGERRLDRVHGLGQHRLVGHHRLLRQALEFARDLGQRYLGVRRGHCQRLRLLDQPRRGRGRGCGGRGVEPAELRGAVAAPAGHRAQQAAGGIEREQRLGHRRLHADHVDQEAERAQVAGQALDGGGISGSVGRCGQRVDIVAHAHHGL